MMDRYIQLMIGGIGVKMYIKYIKLVVKKDNFIEIDIKRMWL